MPAPASAAGQLPPAAGLLPLRRGRRRAGGGGSLALGARLLRPGAHEDRQESAPPCFFFSFSFLVAERPEEGEGNELVECQGG